MSGEVDFDGFIGREALSGTGADASHTAVAELRTVIDRIGFKFHIGKHDTDPAAGTELGT